uniref:Uncharacterized protein n=1 Tax=Davidia involucrata TaxID=16924 RepID=A0A5B7C6X2_DAVIN
MAIVFSTNMLIQILLLVSTLHCASAVRQLSESTQDQSQLLFKYHNGPLLTGKISINLIWYGKFKPSQKAIVPLLCHSLSKSRYSTRATRSASRSHRNRSYSWHQRVSRATPSTLF